ncbi:MAG: outer membrane beta-barrel protein [Bacteroidales bacterium]|nr:outer membrane beta-barrel protein [Bacteroidales bacterium]
MKAMKYFLTAALAVLATGASAQFTNGGSGSASSSGLVKDCTPYNRLYVSYNPQTIEEIDLTGFTVGYTHGISVSESWPVFVELGARLNYSFKNEDMESGYGEWKYKYMNVAVPVNVAYKLTMPNGKLSITPYLGLTFKYNIKATCKNDYEDNSYLEDYETDYFDKDDMGDDKWKRFQVGWQIGAGLSYNALYVGLHYGSDFGEITDEVNTSNWGLTVGVNF